MKTTRAKKLSIILLSLGCTVAAGLGMLFGGWFTKTPKAYTQSVPYVLPVGDDAIYEEFTQFSGLSEADLKFYVEANNLTAEALYKYYLYDKDAAEQEIVEFLRNYSKGYLQNPDLDAMSKEDWFLAPDEVGTYATLTRAMVGIGDSWTAYYTTKAFTTTEAAYWRQSSFQWGHIELSRNVGGGSTGYSGSYGALATAAGIYWDSFWIYDVAWLEEGESLEYGIYSNRKYSTKYKSAMTTQYFMEGYMSQKPYRVRDNAYGSTSANAYTTGTYGGQFAGTDDTALCSLGYDSPRKTREEWKDEFSSNILPYTSGSNGSRNNTNFAVWTSDSGGAGSQNVKHKLKISADAPSGMYYMTFYYPYYGSTAGVFCAGFNSFSKGSATCRNDRHSTATEWQNWSEYFNYGVLVCRKSVPVPEVEYGDGVVGNTRTVNYTGEPQSMTLKGDWGPGLATVVLEEWDYATQTWIASTVNNKVTIGARSAKGAGVKGNTKITATKAGKYRITYTPFRNWTDGSTDPVEFFFEIKPMLLTKTTLVQEDGVDQATNTKFLYATQKDLFVSLYPVSKQWATYSVTSTIAPTTLVVFNYSDNGVLTLSQREQAVYTITVKIKPEFAADIAWDDGTLDGSRDDLVFTFEIGPEKVVVPDIIQDTGQGLLTETTKRVTYNGAYQTMSFMPIVPSQLIIEVTNTDTGQTLLEGIDYVVTDNTLTVRALDAGTYHIKLTVQEKYIFEGLQSVLEYDLIIDEAEVDVPILKEDSVPAGGNKKTSTYGGEKVTINGKVQDWSETLTFIDANESHINYVASDGLSQDTWGDSTLVLKASSAGIYTVTFTPQKNYKWKDGVTPPVYTLEINKLAISTPILIRGGDENELEVEYTDVLKQVRFNGEEHTFTLEFPTSAEATGVDYTKKSSVYIVHNGSFEEEWNEEGNRVTFHVIDADTYTFVLTPTNNYRWADGSTGEKVFKLIILPIDINVLDMRATKPASSNIDDLTDIPYDDKQQLCMVTYQYDGTAKKVIIGNVNANGDMSQMYVTSGGYAKEFFILDDDGNYLKREGLTGIEAKLYDGMTADESGGFLTITAKNAGIYRIAVIIVDTNYWWKQTGSTKVVYTMVIEAQALTQPTIAPNNGTSGSQGYSLSYDDNTASGTHTLNGVYTSETNFQLVADFDFKYYNFVKITDPKGAVYVHNTGNEGAIKAAREEALAQKYGVFSYWNNQLGTLNFYAKDQGTYTWTIEVVNNDYKWAGTQSKIITYTIIIKRSPVSGIEMRYFGDSSEDVSADGVLVGGYTNVRGSDTYKIVYDVPVFTDLLKKIYFTRSNVGNIVKDGFSTQFDYDVNYYPNVTGFTLTPLDKPENGFLNDKDGLSLFALDAGKYEIKVGPSDNYCWNDNGNTTNAVTFTLEIQKRQLNKPVAGNLTKTYNHEYQTFELNMDLYPQGYMAESFVYVSKDGRTDYETPHKATYVDDQLVEHPLGVDKNAKTLTVDAKSAGEYQLEIVVSEPNNYEFRDGETHYLYYCNIEKLKVELPTAYLSTQTLKESDFDPFKFTYADVSGAAYSGTKIQIYEELSSTNISGADATYDGFYHTVYFYGNDVIKGDFKFSIIQQYNNGEGIKLLPNSSVLNPTTNEMETAGYFMFAAMNVDVYDIKLNFATPDFYWSDGDKNDIPAPRTYTFTISKIKVVVPTIVGHSNPILENESYTYEMPYELDTSDYTSAKSQTIELTKTNLGVVVDAAARKYSNVTVKVGLQATDGSIVENGRVLIGITSQGDDYVITLTTALNGDPYGALVGYWYCVELEIDSTNAEWDTGDRSANKKYILKITPLVVESPYLDDDYHGDVHTKNQFERQEVYSGKAFDDALHIVHYDTHYMGYVHSLNLQATDFSLTDNSDEYKDTLFVNTPAPADDYVVTVSLKDPNNMVWADGTTNQVRFVLKVNPIQVAKPYIFNPGNDTTIVGPQRTVTYNGSPFTVQIVNFWFNPNATYDPALTGSLDALTATNVPDVMTYGVPDDELDEDYPLYQAHGFTGQYGIMDYNEYNRDLLVIAATNAGRYVIRFKLTSNAVWVDGSNDDFDITLVIKKIEVPDLEIITDAKNNGEASINGKTQTISYKLDSNGEAVTRYLTVDKFNSTLMDFYDVTQGIESTMPGDGYLVVGGPSGSSQYYFTAEKAGIYELAFKLNDAKNYRWVSINSEYIYYTFDIEKLKLNDPVIFGDYKLANEVVNDGERTLTVDYDLREHTILIKSLYEEQQSGRFDATIATGTKAGLKLGEQYFTVANTTYDDDTTLSSTTHESALNYYDVTSGKTVKSLYEILGKYTYDGLYGTISNGPKNVFALTAYTPGTYHIRFSLVDKDNMIWYNGGAYSDEDIVFEIIINKVKHAAPEMAEGEVTAKQYAGSDGVSFTIANAYNGVLELNGLKVSTESEKYTLVSYTGDDPNVMNNYTSNPKCYEQSWYGGMLTLKFTAVGRYVVRVDITDVNNIEWAGTEDTFKIFTLTIMPRTLITDIELEATNDDGVNASLQAGATGWPLSTSVRAKIIIKNLKGTATGIDDVLKFRIYVEKSTAAGVELHPIDYLGRNLISTSKLEDGTYNLIIMYYQITIGKGDLEKGTYKLHIVQDEDYVNPLPSNYVLPDPNFVFTVEPDPAPFKTDMLRWYYVSSAAPSVKFYINAIGADENHRFTNLNFVEGVSYTFYFDLNDEGMRGFGTGGPYTSIFDALHSWKVDWNGSYSDQQIATRAGDGRVYITLTAYEPDEYAFANYEFNLFYTVQKAKYDLSNLTWNYDGTNPFVYDNNLHNVEIVGLTLPQYPGLTVSYSTSGVFYSYGVTTASGTQPASTASNGAMRYAGEYTTTAIFTVPAGSNYALPSSAIAGSYDGTFAWTRTWEITRQEIEVDWVTSQTTSSTGDLVTRAQPVIAGTHANKFTYTYQKWNGTSWEDTALITRQPNAVLNYKATAYLISNIGNPAADYARNYTFVVRGDNPLEFEVGGDDLTIYNHIELNGTRETQFEYTGNKVIATNIIDLDTTNGIIDTNQMSISIVYYNASTGVQLGIGDSAAPSDVGSYFVKLKLIYVDVADDYVLLEDIYYFDIIKAKIKYSDFEWHVTHDDGEVSYEAKRVGNKWVNIVTNEEVTVEYDDHSYKLTLVSEKFGATVISFILTNDTEMFAGTYESEIHITYDEDHYDLDASSPFPETYEWTINKHLLNLLEISWDYSQPFVFTLVNGSPKAFSVEIKDLPTYLLDKITYTVRRGSEVVEGGVVYAGDYTTEAKIDEEAIDTDNYTLGAWPGNVPTTLSWSINRKEFNVPASDMSWTEFDGVQHNILAPFKLDIDWAEYFDIDVNYAKLDGSASGPYDGTTKYGGKYYAYDAGTYKFTFKIKKEYNNVDGSDIVNIVWVVNNGGSVSRTDNDREVSYIVDRKSLKVTGWAENYESSTVILSGNIDASKFIVYKFYEGVGLGGPEVGLDTVLASGGGDTYSMTAEIKGEYTDNITITFEEGTEYTTFVTRTIDESNAMRVGSKPYISGYVINGVTYRFTNSELASGETFVIYTGDTVEFKIYDWDTYSKYLTVWNGSLDDLIQTEAGVYSITFILRTDLEKPLYWGINPETNKIDRSSVTLTFEIRYRMLTIPELPDEIVYEGRQINILEHASNATLSQLMTQYGDYVIIEGNFATDVGEQVLYLAIKDEYSVAVRWDNNTETGLLGTYTKVWKITPILLVRPEKDPDKIVEYDGNEHSVYEFLKGYDESNMPISILDLMQYVNEANTRAINAGTYTAVLSLPNSNYSWCDAAGKISSDRSSVSIDWTISRKVIDFSNAYWGYYDSTGEAIRYDASKPFVYTIKNGVPQVYSLQIIGMPEILKLYATYTTNGQPGNSGSAVDSYTTNVAYDLDRLDQKNYEVKTRLADELSSITWKIVEREFEEPVYDESFTVYDGEVHDIAEMLGLGEDWFEYFDIKVEYKVTEGGSWAAYNGEDIFVVGYSNYKIYNFGFYRITVSLKSNEPVWSRGNNLVWKDNEATKEFEFVIQVAERDVIVTGWFDDGEYSHVIFKDNETLPEAIAEKFEYVIYEDGDLSKTPVDPSDVVGGKTYYIEFRIKSGYNVYGIAYSYGVNLIFEAGVVNPYEFGNYDFGNQTLMWMPIPVLKVASKEYNGEAQTFEIEGFDTLYKMSDSMRMQINNGNYGFTLDSSVKSFVTLVNANSLTATKAGEYSAVVRLLSKVYLSWYDSELYTTSADHRTLVDKATGQPVENPLSLYNNKSYILNFTITPKKVPLLTDEEMESLLDLVVTYAQTEKDVTTDAKTAAVFEALEATYGKIFAYDGNTGMAAGPYTLTITLADDGSCSWYKRDSMTEKERSVEIDGYRLEWVKVDGSWTIKLVKLDENGNLVKDSANKYVEYVDPEGIYTIDAKYLPDFETEYVKIVDGDDSLLDNNGKLDLNSERNYLLDSNDDYVLDSKNNPIMYEYQTYDDGGFVKYYESEEGSGIFFIESSDHPGTHLFRTKLSLTAGDSYYGYKIPKKEDATEYVYLFDSLTIGGGTYPDPAVGSDGNYITRYLVSVGSGYELREYTVVNGEFKLDAFGTALDYTTIETVSLASNDRYTLSNGEFVIDSNGRYMCKYVLENGARKKQIIYAKDSNGNLILDREHSIIKVAAYEFVTDIQFVIERGEDGALDVTENVIAGGGISYQVEWMIDSSILPMPVFNEENMPQYTGETIYAKDVLSGFYSDYMEIIEGGEGVNAGEYSAKIIITTPNSKWDPKDTTENYVVVKWRIAKAQVDLSNLVWEYHDGTNTYEDSTSFVYTRKNGSAVIHWVQLGNLPDVLKSRVVYTTNNIAGAYAGTDAGKYVTTFAFNVDDNFEALEIPESLETVITWNIRRKVFKIPDVTSELVVFDRTEHDLIELLGMPEDWFEYIDLEIKYSANNDGLYAAYAGHNGNPYVAYESGSYVFTFTIKQGINVSISNPNVVWLKESGETEVPMDDDEEIEEIEAEEETVLALADECVELVCEEAAAEVEEEVLEEVLPAPEVQNVPQAVAASESVAVQDPAIAALQQVCDRIKKLVCGAEVQMNSSKKYGMRGTL